MTKIFFKSPPISPNHLGGNATSLWRSAVSRFTRSCVATPVALSCDSCTPSSSFSGGSDVPFTYPSPASSTLEKWRIQKSEVLVLPGLISALEFGNVPKSPHRVSLGGGGSRGGPAAGYRALVNVTGADIAPRTEWDPSVSLLRCQFALGVHHICHFDLFYSLKESTGRDPIAQPVLPEIH